MWAAGEEFECEKKLDKSKVLTHHTLKLFVCVWNNVLLILTLIEPRCDFKSHINFERQSFDDFMYHFQNNKNTIVGWEPLLNILHHFAYCSYSYNDFSEQDFIWVVVKN